VELPMEREAAEYIKPPSVALLIDEHHEVAVADYETLLSESSGYRPRAMRSATSSDCVADVDRLADEQKALGQPMKAAVETFQSRRVRQAAFRAAQISRSFRAKDH
jgi:hypothetical protein